MAVVKSYDVTGGIGLKSPGFFIGCGEIGAITCPFGFIRIACGHDVNHFPFWEENHGNPSSAAPPKHRKTTAVRLETNPTIRENLFNLT
jgi:hypothetical protein